MNRDEHAQTKVVFFDGVCGFCNRSVDFLIRADKNEVLKFSPLQGEYAKRALPPKRLENLDTIVYKDGVSLYFRSTALLRILRDVGRVWKVFYPLIVIPERWRDAAYRWFARNRYRLFGKRETCRLPTPAERARFLD